MKIKDVKKALIGKEMFASVDNRRIKKAVVTDVKQGEYAGEYRIETDSEQLCVDFNCKPVWQLLAGTMPYVAYKGNVYALSNEAIDKYFREKRARRKKRQEEKVERRKNVLLNSIDWEGREFLASLLMWMSGKYEHIPDAIDDGRFFTSCYKETYFEGTWWLDTET